MAPAPNDRRHAADPPAPLKPVWLELPFAIRDPLGYLVRTAERGGIVKLRRNAYLISEPGLIKHVLQDNHPNYRKGERYQNALRPLFGDGLLTSEGDVWKRQRRLVQPAFKHQREPRFLASFETCALAAIVRWREAAQAGRAIDARDEMIRLTMSALMRAMFGRDTGSDVESLGRAFLAAQEELKIAAIFSPVHIPRWVPTPAHVRFNRALQQIDLFVARLVEERRRAGANENDIVSLLIFSRDEQTGAQMDDVQLRDEIVTLLAAGHDTVTEALTWTLYLLASHADVQERLVDNLESGGEYPDMVLQESMRLYPPIWGFLRTAIADDLIEGYPIPAGSRVIMSPYVVHRSPAIWQRPNEFWPEHFSPANSAERHRFAFFPFSAGPRQCVGGGFATLEMRTIVKLLLRAFQLELVPGQTIKPLPRVSLKPDRGVMIRLKERSGGQSG